MFMKAVDLARYFQYVECVLRKNLPSQLADSINLSYQLSNNFWRTIQILAKLSFSAGNQVPQVSYIHDSMVLLALVTLHLYVKRGRDSLANHANVRGYLKWISFVRYRIEKYQFTPESIGVTRMMQ